MKGKITSMHARADPVLFLLVTRPINNLGHIHTCTLVGMILGES